MWHVWGEKRGAYGVFMGKSEGKRSLGETRHRWEDNTKMDLKEIRLECVDWLILT
jgi:hypothetical protein